VVGLGPLLLLDLERQGPLLLLQPAAAAAAAAAAAVVVELPLPGLLHLYPVWAANCPSLLRAPAACWGHSRRAPVRGSKFTTQRNPCVPV
jgi:hypothetical protein